MLHSLFKPAPVQLLHATFLGTIPGHSRPRGSRTHHRPLVGGMRWLDIQYILSRNLLEVINHKIGAAEVFVSVR